MHFGALASSGPSLDALEQLVKQVFVPLLGANGDGADAEGGGAPSAGEKARRRRGEERERVFAAAEGERDAQRRRRREEEKRLGALGGAFPRRKYSPAMRPSS